MKKRLLSWLLVTAMAVSMIPTTVFADDFDVYQFDSTEDAFIETDVSDISSAQTEDLSENDLYVQNEDGSYTYVYDLDYGDEIDWAYVETDDGGVMAVERQLLTSDMIEIEMDSSTSTNDFGLSTAAPDTSGEDPYDAQSVATVNLTPFSELYTEDNRNTGSYARLYNYDNEGTEYKYPYTVLYANDSQVSEQTLNGTHSNGSYEYARVQAFDAEGSGYKNWIARLVTDRDGTDYAIEFYKIENGYLQLKNEYSLDEICISDMISPWEVGSYLTITAGDFFNGDGKEEVAFVNLSSVLGTLEVYEYSNNVGMYSNSARTIDLDDYIINEDYYKTYKDSTSDVSRVITPVYSLTAGNLFGNKEDDLVLSITTNWYSITSRGFAEGKVVVWSGSDLYYASSYPDEHYTVSYTYDDLNGMDASPRHMATAIGDIDFDGIPDLVVATEASIGTATTIATKSSNQEVYNYITAYTVSGANTLTSKIQDGGDVWSLHYSPYQQYYSTDLIYEPVALTTYAYAGNTDKEYIYLEGNSFEWNSTTQAFDWIDARASANFESSSSNEWFSQAIAGNTTNSATGVESVYQVYGSKISGENKYSFGASSLIRDEDGSWHTDYLTFTNKSADSANLAITLPDYDDDGIYVKYQSTDYFFTDPVISAVLQAAPRFSELDELDGNYPTTGSTEIGSSSSTSSTVSNGLSVSAGVSVGYEYEANLLGMYPLGGVAVSAGVDTSFSSSWETSTETTVSVTYTSESDADRVIVSMIPYVRYNYLMYVSSIEMPTSDEYEDYVASYNSETDETEKAALYDYISVVDSYKSAIHGDKLSM
ncbi:MAG: hypothetical protein R3Y09_04970 [Clostridia bacterium]